MKETKWGWFFKCDLFKLFIRKSGLRILNTYRGERIHLSLSLWEKKGTGTFTERWFSHRKNYNFPLHPSTRSYPFSLLLHFPQGNQIHRGTRGKVSISNEDKISFLNMCWADDCLHLSLTNQKTREWAANYAFDSSEHKPNADVNMSTSPKLL